MSPISELYVKIENGLRDRLKEQSGEIPALEEAIAHALLKGGRRIRPLLTLIIAENLPYKEAALPAALATEYFHAASLVADDLPSMDDAKTRRDHPTTHALFGEANALLVTYALIADGYELLGEGGEIYPDRDEVGERLKEALSLASRATGIRGATGGQFLDLNTPPKTLNTLLDILRRKTAALFGMAFGMGWIFGGGDLDQLVDVERAATNFGLAFQLNDDLADEEEDKREGKACNLSLLLGREKAEELLERETEKFKEAISRLQIPLEPFSLLESVLKV